MNLASEIWNLVALTCISAEFSAFIQTDTARVASLHLLFFLTRNYTLNMSALTVPSHI